MHACVLDAADLVGTALRRLAAGRGEPWALKAAIRPLVKRLDPTFDERNYGSKTLSSASVETCRLHRGTEVKRPGRLTLIPMDQEDPEGHLRSLTAEALTRASPGRPLLPVSLSVQAVANAFVMLGLLPEPRAEEILAQHRLALESKGFDNVWGVTKGELTVRPGAHGYWDARVAGHEGLVRVPLSVAASRGSLSRGHGRRAHRMGDAESGWSSAASTGCSSATASRPPLRSCDIRGVGGRRYRSLLPS